MASAIIMAGGGGTRAAQFVPKQFLTVNDVPVIVYTMINVQKNSNIDNIVVVCPKGWESFVCSYAKQFAISKLREVTEGGETRAGSICNGLNCLRELGAQEKILLIDANRPLVPQDVIDEVIALVDVCDCSVGLVPCYDSMFVSHDGKEVARAVNRAELYKGVGPECARLGVLLDIYEMADIVGAVDASTAGLAIQRNKKVVGAKGHNKCFKITTADDFELFKAYLVAEPLSNIVLGEEQ